MNKTQVAAVMYISSTILFSHKPDLTGLVVYMVALIIFAIYAWIDKK